MEDKEEEKQEEEIEEDNNNGKDDDEISNLLGVFAYMTLILVSQSHFGVR